ncbi:hypothetical protein AOLI_G00014410 [Acnodon oligacanthus]
MDTAQEASAAFLRLFPGRMKHSERLQVLRCPPEETGPSHRIKACCCILQENERNTSEGLWRKEPSLQCRNGSASLSQGADLSRAPSKTEAAALHGGLSSSPRKVETTAQAERNWHVSQKTAATKCSSATNRFQHLRHKGPVEQEQRVKRRDENEGVFGAAGNAVTSQSVSQA